MFSALLRSTALCAPLLLLVSAPDVRASDTPITLSAVLQRTVAQHPSLHQIEARRLAREPLYREAGLRPPLNLALEVENVAGTGTFAGAQQLETTLSLAGVLEWPGKPALRQGVVLSETEQHRLELDQQRRDVLAEAATRYIELAWAEAREQVQEEAVALAQASLSATRRRHQLGAASQADVERARLAVLDAQQQREQLRQLRQGARKSLAMAVGEANWSPGPTALEFSALPVLPSLEALLADAGRAPLVQAAEAGYALAQARLRQAGGRARPDLSWSLGLRHARDSADTAVLAGVGIALGQGRRSQPRQAALRHDSAAAGWARQASELEAGQLIADTWARLSGLRAEFYGLGERLLPLARRLVEATSQGYADGRYSVLEMTTAQAELLQLRQRRLAALADFHRTWIELERVLGQALPSGDAS